jgi:hypothetical protein
MKSLWYGFKRGINGLAYCGENDAKFNDARSKSGFGKVISKRSKPLE